MVTPNTKSSNDQVTDIAQKFREQQVSTVQQGQKISIDAAQNWVKAVSVLPALDVPKIPGVPALPSLEAATKYSFDVATDLLNTQRDFALQLTNVLLPTKSV